MKILLLSRIPPPVGGVTMHTLRLLSALKADGIEVVVLEPTIKNVFKILRSSLKSNIIHVHSFKAFRVAWPYFLALRKLMKKNVLLTLHSLREIPAAGKIVFGVPNYIICVNDEIKDKVKRFRSTDVITISPFLRFTEEERHLFSPLDEREREFFSQGRVISFNAWRVVIEHERDIYGIDTMLEAFSKLYKEENTKLCVCVPGLDEYGRGYIYELIDRYDIDYGRILIIDRAVWFVEIIAMSDAFVRANRSDGDPLSVKEALMLGKPVIASDCVRRPKGVLTFKTGDAQDLLSNIKKALHMEVNPASVSIDCSGNYHRLIGLYESKIAKKEVI